MMMSVTALSSTALSVLPSNARLAFTNKAFKVSALAPLRAQVRAQHHSGEVWRLVNMSYGPPLATGLENPNQSLVTAQMVYPSLNGKPLAPGSTEPLDSLFADAGGYSILTTGKDGEDYRNSVRALKAAQNSHDPYIQHQAQTAQQSLEQAVADKAQNLDVTQALLNPSAFNAAQQAGTLPAMPPQPPSLVQAALTGLQQPAQPFPVQPFPAGSSSFPNGLAQQPPVAQLPLFPTAASELTAGAFTGQPRGIPNETVESWMSAPSLGASALASGLMPPSSAEQQALPPMTNAIYGGVPVPPGQAIYTNA